MPSMEYLQEHLLNETSEMATLDVRLKKVSKIYHEGVCGANDNLTYCVYDTRTRVFMHRYIPLIDIYDTDAIVGH